MEKKTTSLDRRGGKVMLQKGARIPCIQGDDNKYKAITAILCSANFPERPAGGRVRRGRYLGIGRYPVADFRGIPV